VPLFLPVRGGGDRHLGDFGCGDDVVCHLVQAFHFCPTAGKNISLISKKNIRYEGVLYSINEQNATVALQNVRSFGTEGREATEQLLAFVGPSDDVHPFLMFRGQDIKDLHVHEAGAEAVTPAPPPPEPTSKPAVQAPIPAPTHSPVPPKPAATTKPEAAPQNSATVPQKSMERGHNDNRRPRGKSGAAPGTGASLLNRKARGVVTEGDAVQPPRDDFDFQSNLEQFKKEDEEADEAADTLDRGPSAYAKDDFFDSISCDAIDKQSGVNNRLRGAEERSLNTETFGAVALDNSQRRRRGRGYGGGRGGRGRGRGGRGDRGRGRSNSSGGQQRSSTSTTQTS
jgi:protein LSM14